MADSSVALMDAYLEKRTVASKAELRAYVMVVSTVACLDVQKVVWRVAKRVLTKVDKRV